jgi:hypothetical protein
VSSALQFAGSGLVFWAGLIVLLGLALAARWNSRAKYARAASFVLVGDLWEVSSLHPRRAVYGTLFEVVARNPSTEAGPDSWEMRRAPPGPAVFRTLYMHRGARMRGDWVLVFREGRPVGNPRLRSAHSESLRKVTA